MAAPVPTGPRYIALWTHTNQLHPTEQRWKLTSFYISHNPYSDFCVCFCMVDRFVDATGWPWFNWPDLPRNALLSPLALFIGIDLTLVWPCPFPSKRSITIDEGCFECQEPLPPQYLPFPCRKWKTVIGSEGIFLWRRIVMVNSGLFPSRELFLHPLNKRTRGSVLSAMSLRGRLTGVSGL